MDKDDNINSSKYVQPRRSKRRRTNEISKDIIQVVVYDPSSVERTKESRSTSASVVVTRTTTAASTMTLRNVKSISSTTKAKVTDSVTLSTTLPLPVAPTTTTTSTSNVTTTTTTHDTTANRSRSSKNSTIIVNAFTNPYIKSIVQQQYKDGILLQPAITAIRQSSAVFIYKFIAAISEQLPVLSQQVTEADDNNILDTPTATSTSSFTEQHVLKTMRNIISNNEEYQFLIGTLDNIEDEVSRDDQTNKTKKKKKKSTSMLLPASMLTTTRRGKTKKDNKPPNEHAHNEVVTAVSSTKRVVLPQTKKARTESTTQIMSDVISSQMQDTHHPHINAEIINNTGPQYHSIDSTNAVNMPQSIIWDEEEYD